MHKSVFEQFIDDPRVKGSVESSVEPSDNYLTIANAMTVGRPVIAALAAKRLIHGEKGAFWLTALTGSLDTDGRVARWFDKRYPDMGRGATNFGAKADTYADALALLMLGGALLRGPNVPMSAKVGTAIVLGQEGTKAAWALTTNGEFNKAGGEGQLYIVPTKDGKAAMAEKFSAFALAAAASDIDNFFGKQALGLASLEFAVTGSLRGNEAVGQYKQEAAALIWELQTQTDMQGPSLWLPDQSVTFSA